MADPRRRSTNVVSLVAGLVCCGIALSWLLVSAGRIGLRDLGWLMPIIFIGAGLFGVLLSIRRSRRQRRPQRTH
ncbi:hypothetical protein SAMN05421678_101534 [Actinopolymorpha cephalotaxi]|uniref:Apolipoprotein N-acyltransferase n=1 Tax=Actinopolymorpha cephalotaxi TaxID=504797 RepID=A0A1I2KW76_9ACTN|nr:hypothetical protein [Actinopolymorpha cephalotaxi]NYH84677.1 apolipoprotein N-acyltransferase [Actinopolymorpha cephalotaxi]SFF70579.1 hypothetical protein SAMN05421678_101534 [Actinopolymorpha cephalotaxi]